MNGYVTERDKAQSQVEVLEAEFTFELNNLRSTLRLVERRAQQFKDERDTLIFGLADHIDNQADLDRAVEAREKLEAENAELRERVEKLGGSDRFMGDQLEREELRADKLQAELDEKKLLLKLRDDAALRLEVWLTEQRMYHELKSGYRGMHAERAAYFGDVLARMREEGLRL